MHKCVDFLESSLKAVNFEINQLNDKKKPHNYNKNAAV